MNDELRITPDMLTELGATVLNVITNMQRMGHSSVDGHLAYFPEATGSPHLDLMLDLLAFAAGSKLRGDPANLRRNLFAYVQNSGWTKLHAAGLSAMASRGTQS